MRLKLRDPITLFCRLRGPNNITREVSALLDMNFSCSLLTRETAIELGFTDAAKFYEDLASVRPDMVEYFITTRGIERGLVLRLKELSVGRFKLRNFKVVVLEDEISPYLPVDLILGRNFINKFSIKIDPSSNSIYISRVSSRKS